MARKNLEKPKETKKHNMGKESPYRKSSNNPYQWLEDK